MAQEVSAKVLINIPLSAAWERLRDISLAHNYVPGIVKTEIVSEQLQGVGASRYVYRNKSSYLQETVEEWQDGYGFLIHLHKGEKSAPPFKNAWFRYTLKDAGSGQTELSTTLIYEMPWGALGLWLGARMAKFMQSTIADVALSMKLYYEYEEPTTSAALKAYKAQHKT
ncbi:MAG: SRPBCC family protein [Halioglobus sp.]|nr:SRPBCC family protein [Halioglobus sp.]